MPRDRQQVPVPEGGDTLILTPHKDDGFIDFSDMFGNTRPVEIEIGCGKGRFMRSRAATFPDHNFIGVDKQSNRLRFIQQKCLENGTTNIRLLNHEAYSAVCNLIPPDSVSVFYIFFPDPWPKRRHHRRRLFNPEFLDAVYRCMKDDGQLFIATDHPEYFEAIQKIMHADKRFIESDPLIPTEDEKSDFELIFLAENKTIGRTSYLKA